MSHVGIWSRTWCFAMICGVAAAGVWAERCAAEQAAARPPLLVGFAERDITPDIGMEQPGGYGKAYHQSLHDPCKVRATVVDDGEHRAALVSVDALILREPTIRAARRAIEAGCGLPGDAVLIAATHSHSSGPTGMVLPGEFDHADEWVRHLAYEVASAADPGYLEKVESQIAAAVCDAFQLRKPMVCGVGKGVAEGVAFNRRFRMKNGLTFTHPGQMNPDIVEVAGPVDPEVLVWGAFDEAGNLQGCVVNFACHATTSPGGISANWIYYLEKAIRGFFGEQAVVLFLPGFCGDVTQVDNLSPYPRPSGEEWAKLVGGSVGAESVKVLLKMHRGQTVPVRTVSQRLTIARRAPHPDRVRQALELTKKDPKEVGHTDWIFAVQTVLLDAMLKTSPRAEVELQAVQIGPLVILANPAEYFCRYGLELKEGSPFSFTMPVELANGCVGYVPTVDAFGPNGGGYETRLTAYSNLEITAGDTIRDGLLELSRGLTPGPIPEPPRVNPVTSPWTYGNLGPQLE